MVKAHIQDLASMGRPVRFSTFIAKGWARLSKAFGPRCPYRVGDAVVGDDPFNGRREGIVKVINGSSIGLQIIGESGTGYIYYDYRDVAKPD